MQVAINAINELKAEVGKPTWDWEPEAENTALRAALEEKYAAGVTEAYQVSDKMQRYDALGALKEQAVAELTDEEAGVAAGDVADAFGALEKRTVRNRVIEGEPRIDGRDTKTVRAIEVETGVLAKAHGSALFTRGETQAIVVTTLGAIRDSQLLEGLDGTKKDPFMLHYNFPPYSVGEAGFMDGPSDHGRFYVRRPF